LRGETKKGATILLVDDADEYRALMKLSLERRGYRGKTACDEQNAVESAGCAPPDLILLEMGNVPSLRTLDMGCRIRSDARVGGEVKVVVYADRADGMVAEGGEVRLGPNEYVILPEDGEQFVSFIGRLLTTD
jgi:CheY-like chemotaxis protein